MSTPLTPDALRDSLDEVRDELDAIDLDVCGEYTGDANRIELAIIGLTAAVIANAKAVLLAAEPIEDVRVETRGSFAVVAREDDEDRES